MTKGLSTAALAAHKLIRANLFTEAIPLLTEALRFAQNDPILWGQLGLCYSRLSRYEESLSAVEKSLQLRPNARTYGQKTQCLLRLERYEEALESARMQIRLSGAGYGYGMESQALRKLGRLDEAVTAALINVRLTGDTVALSSLAELYRKQRKYRRAIELIEEHISEHQITFGNRFCLAYARMNLRQFNLAFDQFQLAKALIEINERYITFNPYLRLHAGMVFLCDFMCREGWRVPDLFLPELLEAVDWLKGHRDARFSEYQVKDFLSALSIIDKHGL